MSTRPNVFADDGWDVDAEQMKLRGRFVGRAAGARELGATVYVLDPGSPGFRLHTHYAIEELFVVLEGRPSLRTPDAERELAVGDVVACPRGPEGMHTFTNRTEEPARILAVSPLSFPDVAFYPELGKFGVVTRHPFEPVPEGGDPGVVGLFDLPS